MNPLAPIKKLLRHAILYIYYTTQDHPKLQKYIILFLNKNPALSLFFKRKIKQWIPSFQKVLTNNEVLSTTEQKIYKELKQFFDSLSCSDDTTHAPENPFEPDDKNCHRLAYIFPLVSQQLAGYSVSLLKALSSYYKIDIIVDQSEIADHWIKNHCQIYTLQWFLQHGDRYQRRILYHFENTHFHEFPLLEKHPGTVILHHGMPNLKILQSANGIISHSRDYLESVEKYCHPIEQSHWQIIPLGESQQTAQQYYEAIEYFSSQGYYSKKDALLRQTALLHRSEKQTLNYIQLAQAIHFNHPLPIQPKQILVDISALVIHDHHTGIQRVVKNLLKELIYSPLSQFYRIEPVYTQENRPYYYARSFGLKFLNLPDLNLSDEPIEVSPEDIFIGLDFLAGWLPRLINAHEYLKNKGVRTFFVVYDLLPAHHPDFFLPETKKLFPAWLHTITTLGEGAICISKTVANELHDWMQKNVIKRETTFKIGWFHLGANIEPQKENSKLPSKFYSTLNKFKTNQNIIMVSTIEPRKGYEQTLAAFEILWAQNIDVNLIIVGKPGWNMKAFIKKMRKHPQKGKHFFWFESANDQMLLALYQNSQGLLMASKGEGFGLALIEAAQYKLPILVRDLPIFREITGSYATYFSGETPADLAHTLQLWLKELSDGTAISSEDMPWITWKESANRLMEIILKDHWDITWQPAKSKMLLEDFRQ